MINARYSEYVKIQCMEIISLFFDAKISESGIFIGDCLTYCSKFSRARSVLLSASFPHLQDEEKHGLLLFLGSVLRNALLSPSPSSLVSTIQTIHKQLQRHVATEPCSENRCLTPELLYNLGVLSMDCPIHPITIPLVVNELFSLFQDEDLRLRSFACRYSAMLFSELVGFDAAMR